jgi:2-keto-4-pentenoate hydratase/2-oxohepta-3-ene-1,7-dioic acid hydratase in catechol pathway
MKFARAKVGDEVLSGTIDGNTFQPVSGSIFESPQPSGTPLDLAEVKLSWPVEPTKVVGIGYGFKSDPRPEGRDWPRYFFKGLTSLAGDGDNIVRPSFIPEDLRMEVELAIVISSPCHRISPEEAVDHIFGFSIVNDVTSFMGSTDPVRDKACETFCPVGPWIETSITVEDIAKGLAMRTRLDGKLVIEGNTDDHKYTPGEVISKLSFLTPLFPGDIIHTGTPPTPPMAPAGTAVEVEIEGIGVLHNQVVNEKDVYGG